LLFLSRRKTLRRFMETSKFSQPLTRRFVAGMTIEEALTVCRKINAQKILVTLDHLGENVTLAEEAAACRVEALQALEKVAAQHLESTISIKLTQFGMDLGEELCWQNIRPVVEKATAQGSRVELDMESSEYTDRTLRMVTRLAEAGGSVRAVIQAYLHRSEADIRMLCERGIPVRLCKGAYREPEAIAWQSHGDVLKSYLHLQRILLERGTQPAFASHDDACIQPALAAPKDSFEFQMLYGVRRDLQKRLAEGGYRLRLYVPYGDAWYPYFMRRLAEKPANVWFVLRSMLGK
jgi:proline dehydrogenase